MSGYRIELSDGRKVRVPMVGKRDDIIDKIDERISPKDMNIYFKWVLKEYRCSKIAEMVDERIYDYIDNDWEDEFDSEFDAYQEQGRGEAESDVIDMLMGEIENNFKVKLSTNEHVKLGKKIARKCSIDY